MANTSQPNGNRTRPQPLREKSLRSLPPLCRAAVEDPDKALPPRALVEDFLATTINTMLRGLTVKTTLKPITIGGKWLAALLGEDDQLDLTSKESETMKKCCSCTAAQKPKNVR